MSGLALILSMLQATSVPAQALPPEDALGRYTLCVTRMAALRAGSDPADKTAEASAIACENLLNAAVDQIRMAATGTPEEVRHRVGALLEVQARREAVART